MVLIFRFAKNVGYNEFCFEYLLVYFKVGSPTLVYFFRQNNLTGQTNRENLRKSSLLLGTKSKYILDENKNKNSAALTCICHNHHSSGILRILHRKPDF